MKTQPIVPATITFAEGDAPRAPLFGDLYHPRDGAAAQPREVFLAGNGLPGRWAGREHFVIVETGFGLGNNFLATWQAWRDDAARCARLHFVSVDAHPPVREDLEQAHAGSPWPELAAALIERWPPATPNLHPIAFDERRVQLLLGWGDARKLLRELHLQADAIYLDGFAPARNAAMWERSLLEALARRSSLGATAATWSVAGDLRRGLAAAGFRVEKHAGSGAKREVLRAVFTPQFKPVGARVASPVEDGHDRHAIVVGAGLAGAWTAHALVRQGWRVTVLERHAAPAAETSGNPAGIFHGVVHKDDGPHARIFRAAALFAARELQALIGEGSGQVPGEMRGLLRLAGDRDTLASMQAIVEAQGLPAEWVQPLDARQASSLAGVELSTPAWFFARGGWVSPRALVRHLLLQPGIAFCGTAEVANLQTDGDAWLAVAADGSPLARAAVVVLANAAGAATLGAPHALADWPLLQRRAQISGWRGGAAASRRLQLPVAGGGYAIGLPDGGLVCGGGASLSDDVCDASPSPDDETRNFARLREMTGLELPPHDSQRRLEGRVGWRLSTPDRLPLVGPMPLAQMPAGTRLDQARLLPRRAGLFVHIALGSRGLTLAPLAGALLAAQIAGTPWPIEQDLADALDPGRFFVRRARRAAGGHEPA